MRNPRPLKCALALPESAMADLREVVRVGSKDISEAASLKIAWILATNPDERFRDGKQAMAIAAKIGNANGEKASLSLLATTAAAHAELKEFDKAIQYQERMVASARKWLEKAKEKNSKSAMRYHSDKLAKRSARLATFKDRMPFRDDERETDPD